MAKKRTLFLGIAVVALLICSFMAGRGMAQQSAIPGTGLGQQQLSAEIVVPYGFPRSWGGLHSVTPSSSGFAYFFVAADGAVRVVDANAGSIVQIRVIPPR
jgi:hypothetical protein